MKAFFLGHKNSQQTSRAFFAACVFTAGMLLLLFSCKSSQPDVVPSEPVVYTITVNGKVPYIVGEDELNALIKSRTVERYKEFEDAAKKVGIRIEEINDSSAIDDIKEFKFDIVWKAGRHDWDYVSLVITATWQIDQEHAVSGAESFTWNVNNKCLLSTKDILPFTGFDSLESLSAFAAKTLSEKLDPQRKDSTLEKIIEHETAPHPENYSVFLLEKDGVTFYFNSASFLNAAGDRIEPQMIKIFNANSQT